jgi:glutamate-1-semialdehyde 2,1-aminomutase
MATVAPTPAPESSLLGGISSQFRINPYTGQHLVVRRAQGACIETVDGKSYFDMFMAHGSTVLGHGHPAVMQAVRDSVDDGVVIGYETGLGEVVANRLTEIFPSAEKVRFSSSGSEAVSTAIRLARAYTGRDIIVKFDGHFHGGSDYALVNDSSTNADPDNPGGQISRRTLSSGGVPQAVAETVVPVPWNDLPALEVAFARYKGRVAAVLLTPVDLRNGVLTPADGFLAAVREMTRSDGAVLIFDEVLTAFKTGLRGAQSLYGVTPDLTVLSKALTSGVPLAALAGRREVMGTIMKPLPDAAGWGAQQGGTYAGNIIGLSAAKATLGVLSEPSFYPEFLARTERFFSDLQAMFDRSPLPARVQWFGCMFSVYIGTREPVKSCGDIRKLDRDLGRRYFTRCIEEGVYFHTNFSVSVVHTQDILDQVLERMERAIGGVV